MYSSPCSVHKGVIESCCVHDGVLLVCNIGEVSCVPSAVNLHVIVACACMCFVCDFVVSCALWACLCLLARPHTCSQMHWWVELLFCMQTDLHLHQNT